MPYPDGNRQPFRSMVQSGPLAGHLATWRLRGSTPTVMFIRDPNSSATAYRHISPHETILTPGDFAGTVSFDPKNYPDLATLREWFPHLNELWDTIYGDFKEHVFSRANRYLGCVEGRHDITTLT